MVRMLDNRESTSSDFNAIRISIASPEQIVGWSSGEVQKGRDYQLPHAATGKGRTVLREDLRTHQGLGMPVWEVQAPKVQGRSVRPMWS